MVVKLPQRYTISVGDVRVVRVDFTDELATAVSLTGTPTATASTSLAITTTGVAVNSATYVDSNTGNTVAVGKAVQFVVSAGTAAQSPYEITVTAATNSTPAETLKKLLILSCE